MSELERVFSPDVAAILEAEIDRRVREALEALDLRDGSPWLSEADAATYLGVSRRTLQRMIARGRIASTTIGRRRLLQRDELDRTATGEGVAPTTPPRRRGE